MKDKEKYLPLIILVIIFVAFIIYLIKGMEDSRKFLEFADEYTYREKQIESEQDLSEYLLEREDKTISYVSYYIDKINNMLTLLAIIITLFSLAIPLISTKYFKDFIMKRIKHYFEIYDKNLKKLDKKYQEEYKKLEKSMNARYYARLAYELPNNAYEEKIKNYKLSIMEEPSKARYYNLAKNYFESIEVDYPSNNTYNYAIENLEKALKIDEVDSNAKNDKINQLLSEIYYKKEKYELAWNSLQKINKLDKEGHIMKSDLILKNIYSLISSIPNKNNEIYMKKIKAIIKYINNSLIEFEFLEDEKIQEHVNSIRKIIEMELSKNEEKKSNKEKYVFRRLSNLLVEINSY